MAEFRPEAAAGLLLDPSERLLTPGLDEEPPDFADLVARLIEAVGLPRDHCETALRNNAFNVERAAAMLFAGPPVTGDRKVTQQGQNDGEDEVALTDDEKAQITRIQEVTGRDRDYVIQVFVACDRNEEATANCLFEEK
jgi:UV excision repair protein RAD23